jgi:hypothetical protein
MLFLDDARFTFDEKISYLKIQVDWIADRGYFCPLVFGNAMAYYAAYVVSASRNGQRYEEMEDALSKFAPYALARFKEIYAGEAFILRRAEFAGLIFSQHLTHCERLYQLLCAIVNRRAPSITPHSIVVAAHTCVTTFETLTVPETISGPQDINRHIREITAHYSNQLKEVEELWEAGRLCNPAEVKINQP